MFKDCRHYIQARWEWQGVQGVGHGCTALTKESAPSTDVQQPQVDITAYSYYGDLSKRRYDVPERESGDWQGRP